MARTRKKRTKDNRPDDFVEVRWIDSASKQCWCSKDELPAPVWITTRGWVTVDEDYYIVLSASLETEDPGDPHYGESIAIPRVCIEHITKLEA